MKFSLDLPSPFRRREILSFHGRDPERLAEDCHDDRIRKAFLYENIPLEVDFSLTNTQAHCRIKADGKLSRAARQRLPHLAAGLLGLHHDAHLFEHAHRRDPLMGPLIKKQAGLRIPQTATPFEALTWAIIGQQINLTFATTLRRTLIQLAGRPHSSGLWCYPDAASVRQLTVTDLTGKKFSRAKADTLLRAAALTDSGALALDPELPLEDTANAMLAIKGIGPWTVNYVQLRGLGHADCSLHGDAGVKAALRKLTGASPSTDEAHHILESYRPHRSWAAAHLWASL